MRNASVDKDALEAGAVRPPFRSPGDAATLPELIRFLIDRSGYIRALEDEGTPEAISRIENLKELANAAQTRRNRASRCRNSWTMPHLSPTPTNTILIRA